MLHLLAYGGEALDLLDVRNLLIVDLGGLATLLLLVFL